MNSELRAQGLDIHSFDMHTTFDKSPQTSFWDSVKKQTKLFVIMIT